MEGGLRVGLPILTGGRDEESLQATELPTRTIVLQDSGFSRLPAIVEQNGVPLLHGHQFTDGLAKAAFVGSTIKAKGNLLNAGLQSRLGGLALLDRRPARLSDGGSFLFRQGPPLTVKFRQFIRRGHGLTTAAAVDTPDASGPPFCSISAHESRRMVTWRTTSAIPGSVLLMFASCRRRSK